MGGPGTGKTVLSTHIEAHSKDSVFFDDVYHCWDKVKTNILGELAQQRHTEKTIIIALHGLPKPEYYDCDSPFSIQVNDKVAWVLTSMQPDQYAFFSEFVPTDIINNFLRVFEAAIYTRFNTRPYLAIAKDGFQLGSFSMKGIT